MDKSHDDDDDAKNITEEIPRKTDSKKAENLDSPQFQEVVRGFMVEKELLERKHKEEIEKLKESFSKEDVALSRSHGSFVSGGENDSRNFEQGSSSMVGQSMQAKMVVNGTRHHGSATGYSSGCQNGIQCGSAGGGYVSNGSSGSYHGHHSGYLSTMHDGGASSGMMNGVSSHSDQRGREFSLMNGEAGTSHHHNASSLQGNMYGASDYNTTHGKDVNGTLHHNVNHTHSYSTKDTTVGLHGMPTRTFPQNLGHKHPFSAKDTIAFHGTSSGNGIYHANGVKDAHNSTAWNPTFYTHNLFPAKDNTGVQSSSGLDVYGVSLELMNGPSMRVNTDNLASQIRPDLDIEDRLEQQRELLQERYVEEKRQLRQIVQEEFAMKFEVDKRKQEGVVQTLQKTILELEYQKKEVEVKIRHERESLELKFESQRTEYERKCRKQAEEHRNKSSTKYETEIIQQKETYEGIIEKLKNDIRSLTSQLEELNENLKREKDNVVAAFEKEIEDFKTRMRIEKEKTDSENIVKLKSEISLLNSVNKSLREEIDNKEREKQELETLMKQERQRTELNYENQISEIEAHFESEKQTLLVQYEEKVTLLLTTEKTAVEENSQKSSEELIAVKKENETLKEIVENSFKMEQETTEERDEMLRRIIEEKDLLAAQLQELVAKQQATSRDTPSREEYERFALNAQRELQDLREFSAKIQRDLKDTQEEREVLRSKVDGLSREIKEFRKEKLNANALKDERNKLLNEVSKLNEEIDKIFEDVQEKSRKEVLLKEQLSKVEDCLHQKESENTQFKIEKMEYQNKLAVLERQVDDLRNDLSTMRRRKVELDEENCNLKKEKSSSDGRLVVLQTTNDGFLQELQKVKRSVSELEEQLTALKLEKLELQQQLRLNKMQQSNYEDVSQRLNSISDSDGSSSVLTSAEEGKDTRDKDHSRRSRKKSSLEKQICRLKREKAEYEMRVESLKQDVESLEREALKQIEHNKTVSVDFVSKKKDFEREMEELKRQREELEASIVKIQHEERGIKNVISALEKQKAQLDCTVSLLGEEEEIQRKAMEAGTNDLHTKVEEVQRQTTVLESTKKELQGEIENLEVAEASLRCSIEELQQESQLLSRRITEMKDSVREVGRKRVSWLEDKMSDDVSSMGFNDVMEEITKLRRERDGLIRDVNELERKQTNLDINVETAEKNHQMCEREVNTLSRKRSELESVIFALKTEKFELETRISELSTSRAENTTSAQRNEIEMLRNELEITRENCEDIRSMYHEVQNEGKNKAEVVESELRLAEENLVRLKRERLELEKIISTLLRQKTELESEVAMIVDSKYREDRDTNTLREERLNLDTDLVRIRSEITELRSVLSNLEDVKTITEHELRSLDARKERVDSYVSGMETRLLIGQPSPVSWNIGPPKEYILTPRDDLEKQVLDLREQKLSLEADLFKLRRKSGDGIDTRSCAYHGERISGVNMGCMSTTGDCVGQYGYRQDGRLQQDIDGLAQQRSKLSGEVQEMQVKKTDLDAQITNLEYRKLGLEQTERLVTKREDAISKTEVDEKHNESEDYSIKMGFVNYSVEQMQELRQKNASLEDKLSVLEDHLHDAKYEMEKQTLEYQRELKLVQNALMSQQHNDSGQHLQLSIVVERLKNFIEASQLPETDQLYEEIKEEIRALNRKVELNSEKMRAAQEGNWKMSRESSEMRGTVDSVDEICGHLQDAEVKMERYNEIVSHLQQENTDLMEVVSRLEKRLTAAGKSHELLQRKKTILQQLLETTSVQTGQDLIEQSNLIFELDKDTAI